PIVLEAGRCAREEEEEPARPGPHERGRARRARGLAAGAAHRLGEGEGDEQYPRDRPRRVRGPEEAERIAGGVPRQLAVEEEKQVLVHDVVPCEPRMTEGG